MDHINRTISEYMRSLSEEGSEEVAYDIGKLEVGDHYTFGLVRCVVTSKNGMKYLFDAILH